MSNILSAIQAMVGPAGEGHHGYPHELSPRRRLWLGLGIVLACTWWSLRPSRPPIPPGPKPLWTAQLGLATPAAQPFTGHALSL